MASLWWSVKLRKCPKGDPLGVTVSVHVEREGRTWIIESIYAEARHGKFLLRGGEAAKNGFQNEDITPYVTHWKIREYAKAPLPIRIERRCQYVREAVRKWWLTHFGGGAYAANRQMTRGYVVRGQASGKSQSERTSEAREVQSILEGIGGA